MIATIRILQSAGRVFLIFLLGRALPNVEGIAAVKGIAERV